MHLVELSRFNSNKYGKILSHQQIVSSPKESISKPPHSVNEHGEVEVRRVIQPHKFLSDKEITAVIQAYRSGKTTYELAEQYGCCRPAIVSALKRNGITPDKAKAKKLLNAEEVVKLYNEFHTTSEIAAKFGVSSHSVITLLRANNIPIRTRWDYPRMK